MYNPYPAADYGTTVSLAALNGCSQYGNISPLRKRITPNIDINVVSLKEMINWDKAYELPLTCHLRCDEV